MFPRLLEIGSFSLPTYGLLIAAGFLVGVSLSAYLARRTAVDAERITNLGIVLLLSAIVGAKLFLIANSWSYYAADPGRLFSLSALRSGGVFYGGLVTALAVSQWYTRRHGLPWLATADLMVPGLAFGHAIGRMGCFAAGCCWGHETDVAWAVTFRNPVAHEFTGVPLHVALHPTQLYEMLGTALIGAFLLWRFLRPHAPGTILGYYLVLYSVFRFAVEPFRAHEARPALVAGTVSTTQLVALALAALGAWLVLSTRRRAGSRPVSQARVFSSSGDSAS